MWNLWCMVITKERRSTMGNTTTAIPAAVFTKGDLNAKEIGIFMWLWLAQSEGEEINVPTMVEAGLGGGVAVRSGLTELEEKGYLVRSRARSEKGFLAHTIYTLYPEGNGAK
jgi:hypothetical protein